MNGKPYHLGHGKYTCLLCMGTLKLKRVPIETSLAHTQPRTHARTQSSLTAVHTSNHSLSTFRESGLTSKILTKSCLSVTFMAKFVKMGRKNFVSSTSRSFSWCPGTAHKMIVFSKYLSSVVHGLFERALQISSFCKHNLDVLLQAVKNV